MRIVLKLFFSKSVDSLSHILKKCFVETLKSLKQSEIFWNVKHLHYSHYATYLIIDFY